VTGGLEVRSYEATDEPAWLRCRVLSFLGTAYFDDVLTAKPEYDNAIQLVALDGSELAGLLDVAIESDLATIETIAVDPGRFRGGVGSALFGEARRRLPRTVQSLDAWTRDDEQANGWYAAKGFVETFRYLHVYVSSSEEAAGAVRDPRHGMVLVKGFFHAPIEAEAELRGLFRRVHVCKRYVLDLGAGSQAPN
jgi:ribosomal protein S18 acetylase RimI-like enzyme